eukprot:CAMPEP_0181317310 /NCGR_PEP_ID=MMETSP1101-20121128/16400_1 /TAXON_ID=46948 /ORGANISM="Rhodomonas abbreviata, Strain Caron Lab Isolate" /LENGTH=317 /DNA_ID=CAMNT_0023424695 /DNA_START=106 /DNA_END=1056 /DNA_ORIENTATION=-
MTRGDCLGKRRMDIDDNGHEEEEVPAAKRFRPRPRRHSVSAPPTGAISEDTVLLINQKTDEVKAYLQRVLKSIFIFQEVEGANMDTLIGSFHSVEKSAGTKIITQGEDGDNFYVIKSGTCDIYVASGDGEPERVLTLSDGGYFGELALMYHCPRAATVIARTDVVLEALDQNAFNVVLRRSGRSRRATYDAFLQKVPILHSLTSEDRGKLADVLVQTKFADGEHIIRQGDVNAYTFFILYEGAAAAILDPGHKHIARYGVGDYFGELALITDAPRAANVVAMGPCTVVVVDRAAFIRLLGPCLESMREHTEEYTAML